MKLKITNKIRLLSLLTLVTLFASLQETWGQATITTYTVSRATRSYDTSYSVQGYCMSTGIQTYGQSSDDGSWVITLPFGFNFNGKVYGKVTMCTNGWLGLGDNSSTSFTAANGFSNTAPNNIIMPWFRDNNANYGVTITGNGGAIGGMRYGNGDSTGVFVAEWRNVAANGGGGTSGTLWANYQVWLWGPSSSKPGRVEIHYGPSGSGISTSAAIGLEDSISGSGRWINMAAGASNTSTTLATAYPGTDSLYRFEGPPLAVSALASQQQTGGVGQSATNATILRVDLTTTGLIGNLNVTKIRFNTQNTDNNDVTASGVKLWTGTSTAPVTQVGSAQTIAGDSVVFSGISSALANGVNYLWLTYDVSATATLGNNLDARVSTGDLTITSSAGSTNPGSLPASDLDPSSARVVAVPMTYSTTVLHQAGNSNIAATYNQSATNSPIVCIKLVTSSTGSAVPLTALSFTTAGTNNVSTNIQNAKIFYTGASNTFATTTQFGSTIAAPSASPTNNRFTGTVNLINDTNYLWLTYDVKAAGTKNDSLDATIDSVTVSGTANAVSPKAATGFSLLGPLNPKYTVTKSTGVSYTSIMATGNTHAGWINASGDDNTSNAVNMPFSFSYLGAPVTSFRQCTNGWMTLNGANVTATSFTNSITGNSSTQNSILAPMWDDLVMPGQNFANANASMRWKVDTITASPLARVLTVEWAGIERFNQSSPNLNFQVKLYEGSNNIEYRYGEMTGFTGSSAITYTYTIGMNNATTATATSVDFLNLAQSRTDRFNNTAQNSLSWLPECNSSYLFVAGTVATGTNYPGIVNNDCAGAIGLTVGNTASTSSCNNYRTLGATATSGITACSASTPGTPDDDVWFTFTNSQTQNVTVEVAGGNGFDAVVQVFTGTCGSLTAYACQNNSTSAGIIETMTLPALPAATYFMRVYHSGTGFSSATADSGVFNLNIYAVPPPVHDDCSGAKALTINGTSTCTTSTTDTTVNATASTQTVCTGTASRDLWYYFQANATGLDVTLTPGNVTFNGVMQVFNLGSSNDCNNAITANQLGCFNSTGSGQNEVANLTGLTVNNYYAIRVYHFLGGAGGNGVFTMCITTPPKVLGTITANQQTGIAKPNSNNNPIMRLNFPVVGGTGSITLTSLTVRDQSTTASDITQVKLQSTAGTSFTSPTVEASGTYSAGVLTFSGLNISLTGSNNLWITYDVSSGATISNTLDCFFNSGDFTITAAGGATAPGTQPAAALNPTGSVTVDQDVDYIITRSTGITYSSIMATGTSLGFTGTSGDDQTSPAITFPFTFTYQGRTVASFRGCTNGWMTLNGANVTSSSFSNAITGNSATQNAILAPFWDDLITTGFSSGYSLASQLDQSIKYKVLNSSPNRVLVVEWAGMEKFGAPGPSLNFQVRCYETSNKIEFVYGSMSGFDGTTISEYSYSVGINSFGTTTQGIGQVLAQQSTNTNVFDAIAVDNQSMEPACNTMIAFTTGTHGAGTAAAAITNDECSGAIALSVDAESPSEICQVYRTEGATASSGVPACAGTPSGDVWFQFTLAAPKKVIVDLRSSPSFDGVLQVLSGTCGSYSSLDCQNATGQSLTEVSSLNLAAGTYFIRVYHSAGGVGATGTSKGDFALFVYDAPIPPVNDTIAGALTLTGSATCVSSVLQRAANATASGQFTCGGTPSKDLWYRFQAVYPKYTFTVTPNASSGYNAQVQVFNLGATFDTTQAISGNSIACQNNTGTGQNEVVSLTNLVPGNHYAVRVYHAPGGYGLSGKYTVCLTNPTGFWNGALDTIWTKAANWSDNAIPTATTDVTIMTGWARYPRIASGATCRNLAMTTGGSITTRNGAQLNIFGTFTNTGTFTALGGTTEFKTGSVIPGLTYHILRLSDSTIAYSLGGNVTVNNNFFMTAAPTTLANAGNSLSILGDPTFNGSITGSGMIKLNRVAGYSNVYGNGTLSNVTINTTSTGGARSYGNLTITDSCILNGGTWLVNNNTTFTLGAAAAATGVFINNGAGIISSGSSTNATLVIQGNASAPALNNLKFTIAKFILNRANGAKLGAISTIYNTITLTNGALNLNGNTLNAGATSTAVTITTTGGKFSNSLATGILAIGGNASSPAISSLNIDSMAALNFNFPAGATLNTNMVVNGQVKFYNGKINLNGMVVTLGSTGSLSEIAGTSLFTGNSGYITTTRTISTAINTNNIAGMGLQVTTNIAPGLTTIRRGHTLFTTTGQSIRRYYGFNPANDTGLIATLFINYDSSELAGANRGFLRMSKSVNNGTNWTTLGGGARTTAATASGYAYRAGITVPDAGAWFTLSDSVNTPLVKNMGISNQAAAEVKSFSVYPNPFNNQLNIRNNGTSGIAYQIQLVDLSGKMIASQQLITNGLDMSITLPEMPAGIYFVRMINNQDQQIFKVVKE